MCHYYCPSKRACVLRSSCPMHGYKAVRNVGNVLSSQFVDTSGEELLGKEGLDNSFTFRTDWRKLIPIGWIVARIAYLEMRRWNDEVQPFAGTHPQENGAFTAADTGNVKFEKLKLWTTSASGSAADKARSLTARAGQTRATLRRIVSDPDLRTLGDSKRAVEVCIHVCPSVVLVSRPRLQARRPRMPHTAGLTRYRRVSAGEGCLCLPPAIRQEPV